MMETASDLMSFDWVREEGHESCQKAPLQKRMNLPQKKRDSGSEKIPLVGTSTQFVHISRALPAK